MRPQRLNIGLELVAKPSLLMLDEPTSGLDAAVSYDVVHALKLMAEVRIPLPLTRSFPPCARPNAGCVLNTSCWHDHAGPQSAPAPYVACCLQAGMNVMVVIHQPRYSIFEMFDSVLLLGVGGRTVFLGPVSLARKYFFFLGFRPPPGENRAGEREDAQPLCGRVRARAARCNTRCPCL